MKAGAAGGATVKVFIGAAGPRNPRLHPATSTAKAPAEWARSPDGDESQRPLRLLRQRLPCHAVGPVAVNRTCVQHQNGGLRP